MLGSQGGTEHALGALRRARLSDLHRLQSERGHDAVLLFAQGGALGAATRSHACLRLFVDWDACDQLSVLVLAGGRLTLLVTSPFQLAAAARLPEPDAVDYAPPAAIGPKLAAILGAAGLPAGASIGAIGMAEMPLQSWHSLNEALPGARFADLSPDLDLWRRRKAAAEIAALERAAGLCDLLFDRFGSLLSDTRPAWRTQRDLEHVALTEGAEYCRTWLTIGPQADGPRYLKQECLRSPQSGDQVLLGLMLKREGYWGHAIRMGSYRDTRPEHLRLHEATLRMFEAGLPHLRAGADLRDAERAMNAVLAGAFGDRDDIRRFRNGHGVGLSYEEPGSVTAFPQYADPSVAPVSEPHRVEADEIFELHPNLFVPGLGGAALGEMVHAGAGGPRRLLSSPLDYRRWT